MSNYFEALAQRQMVATTKAKHRTAEKRAAAKVVKSERDAPMKLSEQQQAQQDKNTQLKQWHAWRRSEIDAVLQGPDGENYRELTRLLHGISLEDSIKLVEYVKNAVWLHETDLKTRQIALSAIAAVIIRVRIANGYPPFDDSLPGEALTVFEIIRNELKVLA